jgi:hypothetical protein
MVIADKDYPGLICATRGIMLGGAMVEGFVYLVDGDAVRRLKREYEIISTAIEKKKWDARVRDKLANS